MDPKLLYWTGALINLAVIVSCGLVAVYRIRRRDVRGHRRMMLCAATLVALFLVSYVFKLALLGAEDRASWTRPDFALLYIHEFCIAIMLLGGVRAALCARRFCAGSDGELRLPLAPRTAGVSAHRRAGRAALCAGVLALLTAAGVLAGMYTRSAG